MIVQQEHSSSTKSNKRKLYEISISQQNIVHSSVQEAYSLELTHLHFMKQLNIEGYKSSKKLWSFGTNMTYFTLLPQ